MGFQVKRITKGIYVDGHERADVIEARNEFLKTMTSLGFLQPSNAPNEETAKLLPDVPVSPDRGHLSTSSPDHRLRCSYQNIDDTMQVIKPKGRGAGLMVSDFIEERDGYLTLSDSMYQTVVQQDASIPQSARVIFEYGKNRDGYWNNELFIEQMEVAIKVAEAKYPLVFTSMSGSLIIRVVTQHLQMMLLWPHS